VSLRSRKAGKKNPPRPAIRDPFAVVPLLPDNVEIRRDSAGNAHLRMQPKLKALTRKVADWLNYDYSRKVELDESGTLFVGMADGHNRLHDIVDCLVAKSGRERKDVEEGVILFTKKLMTMNMMVLKVED
jgi:hypothetical protein